MQRLEPTPVLAGPGWRAAAPGWAHTVAVRSDGTLWGWGWNDLGQLGEGVGVSRWTLGPVP